MKLNKVVAIPAIALAAGLGLAACGSVKAPAAAPAVTHTVTAPAAAPKPTTPAPAPANTVYVPAPVAAPAPTTTALPPLSESGMTNCTGGADEADTIWAGANTSCPFALNVAANYSGPGVDYAWSPVTNEEYAMNCISVGAGTVECTGGDNAYVQF